MQLCKDCYIQMVGVMSFSKDKHEKFCRCPKCRGGAKHQRLKNEELNFVEVLSRELHKK